SDPFSRRTIAVSEVARDRYVNLRAIPARKAGVIANGIETDYFLPNPQRHNEMRTEMGVAENDFVWIAVGRLAPAKDYPNLLHAFSTLFPEPPAAKLWIIGAGERSYTDGLRTLAQ